MVECILKDKKKIEPCSVYLQGEYGIHDLFVGVPVKLGARGVEQIIQITLNADEQAALQKSANAVKELVDVPASAAAEVAADTVVAGRVYLATVNGTDASVTFQRNLITPPPAAGSMRIVNCSTGARRPSSAAPRAPGPASGRSPCPTGRSGC